ncbi:MAG: hypothetical protein GY928_13200 [Colwellia sp.]|nr:hypothetical protein [Colwellia sp.]
MITIVKELSDFEPHMALCGMNLNKGSANGRNTACITKGVSVSDELAILKRLGKVTPDVIEKASARNTESMLRAVLEERFRGDQDYFYVWIRDFDGETVVYEIGDTTYSLGYTTSENDIVALKDETPKVAVSQTVYVSEEGDTLILKGNEDASDTDENLNADDVVSDANTNLKGDNMTDNVELTQEQLIQKAVDSALNAERATVAEAKLTETTETIVKGFDFIEGADVEVIVKALVASEHADIIIKALDAGKQKVAAVEAEMVEVRKSFADKEQVTEEVVVKSDEPMSAQELMKANMQASLEAKQLAKA